MRRTTLRRLSCFIFVIVMICCNTTQAVSIQQPSFNDSQIVPMYVRLQIFNVGLQIENGLATCTTRAQSVSASDTITTKIELQQKKSSWSTIKDWNESDIWIVDFSEPWHVVSGYDYRLAVTATVTNSAGSNLETVTKYSSIVSY